MRIETERLVVRMLQREDADAMQQTLQDFEQSEYRLFDYKPPVDMDRIEVLMRYWVRSRKYYTLILKESEEKIGFISVGGDEIGFSLKTEFHNQGYGYEGTKAVIDYLSDKKKIKVFTAQAALENIPSVKLLEKLGFVMKSTEEIQFRRSHPPVLCGNYELKI